MFALDGNRTHNMIVHKENTKDLIAKQVKKDGCVQMLTCNTYICRKINSGIFAGPISMIYY